MASFQIPLSSSSSRLHCAISRVESDSSLPIHRCPCVGVVLYKEYALNYLTIQSLLLNFSVEYNVDIIAADVSVISKTFNLQFEQIVFKISILKVSELNF